MILLDANVILDIWDDDPVWYTWSSEQVRILSFVDELAIDPIVYAEISPRFSTSAHLDEKLEDLGVIVIGIPRRAAFLAGKAYVQYRRQSGTKSNVAAKAAQKSTSCPTSSSARTLPYSDARC